jgi:hypothetical protein
MITILMKNIKEFLKVDTMLFLKKLLKEETFFKNTDYFTYKQKYHSLAEIPVFFSND